MAPISLFVTSHRSKAARDKNRDISEKIALGLPNAGNVSQEALYDQRLFNSTKVSYFLKSVLSLQVFEKYFTRNYWFLKSYWFPAHQ